MQEKHLVFLNTHLAAVKIPDIIHKKSNGRDRSRTDDLLLARQTRYQLRHTPGIKIKYPLDIYEDIFFDHVPH